MADLRDILNKHDGHVLDEFNNPTPWEPRYICSCGETVKSWVEHVAAAIESVSGANEASKDLSVEEADAQAFRAFNGAYTEVHTDLILRNKDASGFARTRFARAATKAALAAASPILRGFGVRQAHHDLASIMDGAGEATAAQIIRNRATDQDKS